MVENLIKTRIRSNAVTITTTATQIPANPLPTRKSVAIRNNGAATVYLGHSGVTTSNGYPLDAGKEFPIDIGEDVDVYGIVTTGTVEVRILEGT